ncbi:MAG: hypothetical protein OEY79_00145 [Anaplasmataceae bacterium]|nr:hypothetical protein [Anaplasmataceae bacterium]
MSNLNNFSFNKDDINQKLEKRTRKPKLDDDRINIQKSVRFTEEEIEELNVIYKQNKSIGLFSSFLRQLIFSGLKNFKEEV